MIRRLPHRERTLRAKVTPRRFRFVGLGPVTLPVRLGRQILATGDVFTCDELDWSLKAQFELAVALVPLPVIEPEPTTLTPEQFGALSFGEGRAYALSLYGIKARSKKELLREYTAARG